MSYLDPSDDDDRTRGGRPVSAARPAWDAATYGTPEDLRRSRRGRRAPRDEPPRDPAYDPPPYGSPPYESTPYPPPYDSGPYDPAPYDPAPYDPSRYEPRRHAAPEPAGESYAPAVPESYAADPSANESYAADQYGSDPYGSDQYAAEGYGDQGYPGGYDESEDAPAAKATGRAGRNLPAAIGVGVLLGGVAVASLFLWRPAFLAVVAIAIGIGIWELVRAIRTTGVNPPLIPLVAGGALMTGLAWYGQADALTFGLLVTVLATMVWRLADGVFGYSRDVTAATLVAVYVPFLAGFAALLASPADGDIRVLVTLAGVVLSDTGGYIAGVLLGKHPMAPSVSPKKSWEGLAGSLLATAVGSAILLSTLMHTTILQGALFGLAVSAASVLGDLGESMIKRDLGVKDMSNLLPGHGGLMDRLDSILFAAPTAYALLLLIAPPVLSS